MGLLPLIVHANDLVPVTGVVDVSSGGYGGDDICVVLSSGAVKCYRILVPGDAPDTYFFDQFILNGFVEDFPELSNIKKFASSFGTNQTRNCAITTAGAAICWGNPYYLGLGIEEYDYSFPTGKAEFATPVGLESGVESIALGNDRGHACALMTTGEVKCWGPIGPVGAGSNFGQLGIDRLEPDKKPQTVVNLSGAIAIALGTNHSCALLNSGTVKCWGHNWSGEIGNGTKSDGALTPVDVVNLIDVKAITAGYLHVCALTNAGAVKCWGNNDSGQLGNGTRTISSVPVDVIGLNSGVIAIAAGQNHTCALLEQGNVKCWGYNSENQLGNNQHNINYGGGGHMGTMLPVDVIGEDGQGLGGKAVKLVAGRSSTCALMEDSTVKCWGSQGIVVYSERVGDLNFASSKVITVMMEKPQTSGIQVSAPTDGLVAYYPFEGDVKDAENGHEGVIYRYTGSITDRKSGVPVFRAGKIGNAVRFNGVEGSKIEFPTLDKTYFGTNDFTLNFFVKFNLKKTEMAPLSKRGEAGRPFFEIQIDDGYDAAYDYEDYAYRYDPFVAINDGKKTVFVTYGRPLVTDTWYSLTLVRQGKTLSIYVDGQLTQQKATETIMDLSNDALFGINNNPGIGDYYGTLKDFSGKLDELRVYNRALTDAEIQTLVVTPPVTSTLTVTVTKTGSGRVTSDNGIDCGATCLTAVAPNSQMTLSATADSTYQFTGWSGSDVCTGSQNPLTLLVTQTQTCQANFELIPPPSAYPLTITKTGQGQGTVSSTPAGIACGDDCQETYPSGQALTLVATPAAGSQFAGWQGDCQGQTAEVSLTMTTAKSCAAQFEEMPISPPPLGAGKDCATILATDPSSPSGYYQIDPDGEGNLPPLMTYCDQTTDGGGWTVINYLLDPTWQNYFTSWRPIEGNTMTIPDTSDNASRTLTQWFKLATPETAFRRSATCQTVTAANVQGEAYAATGNFYGCT